MDVLVALHASAALVVLVAGVLKIARPGPTVELLSSLGVEARPVVASSIGGVEAVVGLAALAVGGALTAAVTGLFYVGFTVVVLRALAVGATSCGCFGRAEAPPSWVHVIGNVVFAVVSFGAIGGDTPVEIMDRQPAGGVGFVVLVGVISGLALVAFTALPEALSARRGAPAPFRVGSPDQGQE